MPSYKLVSLIFLQKQKWNGNNDCNFSNSTAIRQEIRDIEQGIMDKTNNPLKVA